MITLTKLTRKKDNDPAIWVGKTVEGKHFKLKIDGGRALSLELDGSLRFGTTVNYRKNKKLKWDNIKKDIPFVEFIGDDIK